MSENLKVKLKDLSDLNPFLQGFYSEENFANTIIFFRLLYSYNEGFKYSSLVDDILSDSQKEGITLDTVLLKVMKESNVQYKGYPLNGFYIVHNPKKSEGRKIFLSEEIEAYKILEIQQSSFKGSLLEMPDDLYVALTGLNKDTKRKLYGKIKDLIGELHFDLQAQILKPEEPLVVPITYIPKKGQTPARITNKESQETFFNLRYMPTEYV